MGNAASEMQHIANQLQGAGPDEKRFMAAVYEGKPQEAADVLKTNPNVIYARTKEWQNAWHLAAESGNLQVLEVLHKYGRNGTRKPLPGEPAPVNHKTKKGLTPLMVACLAGHQESMQFMMAVGAEITDADSFGNTAVHYAAFKGHAKILEILLAKAEALGDASHTTKFVDLRNEAGLQPLHFAAWAGHVEAARVLLNYTAQLTGRSSVDSMAQVTCNGGSTPLHVAALKNNKDMVAFLLGEYARMVQNGPIKGVEDPRKTVDNYNFTPQQLAINLKRDAAVISLLDPKAKLKVPEVHRQPSIRRTTSGGEQRLSPASMPSSRNFGTGAEYIKSLAEGPKAPQPVAGAHSAPSPVDGRGSNSGAPQAHSSLQSSARSYAAGTAPTAPKQPARLPPSEFICPITNNAMEDPVTAADGRNYESSAIKMWYELGNHEFPGGDQKITSKQLQPNNALHEQITAWKLAGTRLS